MVPRPREAMSDISGWMPPLAAFATTMVLLALLIRPKFTIALDRPNLRSLHERPVPRTGGLAMILGVSVAAMLAPAALSGIIWAGLVVLVTMSFLDDIYDLPVALRLSAHIGVGGMVAAWLLLEPWGVVAMLAGALTIAWMINLYNFMDGSDGMAGGMTGIGFAAYGWFAFQAGNAGMATLCFSLAAAAAAFLAFNFPPARIFMGDCGSVTLGFLAATMGLFGWLRGLWPLWLPPLLFSFFIVDASTTLAKRILTGKRFWEAHRDHYYQRLIRMGWSHRRTALAGYGLMLAAAALGLALTASPVPVQALGLAGWLVVLALLMFAIDLRWRKHTADFAE